MQQIKFTHTGHSAAFGSFQAGDLLRCSDAAALHFVVDAGCAEYVGKAPAQAAQTSVPPQNQACQHRPPSAPAGLKEAT